MEVVHFASFLIHLDTVASHHTCFLCNQRREATTGTSMMDTCHSHDVSLEMELVRDG